MSKRVLYALLLIVVLVVVLILNAGDSVTLVLAGDWEIRAPAPMIYLVFSAAGVAIGVLLK